MLNHNLIIDVIDELFPELTKRQSECLYLLTIHPNQKTVGAHLGISPTGVESHIVKIKEKLGCLTTYEIIITCKFRLDSFYISKLLG